MSTTIEIPDRYRNILLSLAARKGKTDYTEIVEEALEQYIAGQMKTALKDKVLDMRGTWKNGEVEEIKSRLFHLRKEWKAS